MSEQPRRPAGQGLRRFTQGLFFFLAGLGAFTFKDRFGHLTAKVLVGIGLILFFTGFVFASRGIARHWQEAAHPDGREDA